MLDANLFLESSVRKISKSFVKKVLMRSESSTALSSGSFGIIRKNCS
jgi:hypothetical protein